MIEFAISTLMQLSQMKTEVQFTLCDSKSSVYKKIENNDWKLKKKNYAYFIDNSQLQLYKNGIVIRSRAFPDKDDVQVVLKKNYPIADVNNPIDQSDSFEDELLNDDSLHSETCEYDLHGFEKKVACKIEHHMSYKKFLELLNEGDWKGLLNDEQKQALLDSNPNLKLDSEIKKQRLVFAGPFYDQNYIQNHNDEEISLGITTYGENSEFVEASVRSKVSEELKAQRKLQKVLVKQNMNLCENQSTHLTEQKLKAFFTAKP